MIPILHGLLGLLFVTFLAFLFSTNKKAIDWKLVLIGILLQFAFAILVIKTAIGRDIFAWISGLFVALFSFAADGAQFVFGPLGRGSGEGSLGVIFAFQVLPTIIFFAAFMAVLYHLGIMQWIVKGMAWVMQR
ncbi:MAG TPA: Na+ dependent nucleoside transporter N-terminal domain-containing protein, partial [bacterium]|nr:Na+ dependent nucleoside transporter N-terminal domain-containing protein [bacterium]